MLTTKSTKSELEEVFKSLKIQYTYDKLDGYMLAGRGRAYYSERDQGPDKLMCGGFSVLIGCENHYKKQYKIIKHSCDRMECPVCYQNWAYKRAEKSTIRMLRIYEAYKREGINLGLPKHVIVSPEPETFLLLLKERGYVYTRKEIYKVLRKAGFIGGQIVFHLWRKNDETKHWDLGPHFHIVGWGHLINVQDFVDLFPNWKYKNLKGRAYPKDINKLRYNPLFKTCKYEYSHASKSIGTNSHVMTWFGCASYNKLIKTEIITRETIDCQICSEPYVRIKRTIKRYTSSYCEKDSYIEPLYLVRKGKVVWWSRDIMFGSTYFIKKIDYCFEIKGPPVKNLEKSYEKIYPTFQEWKNGSKIE